MKRSPETEAETREIRHGRYKHYPARNWRKGPGGRLRTPEALTLILALVSLIFLLPLRPVLEPVPVLLFLAALGLFLVPGLTISSLALEDSFTGPSRLPAALVISIGVFGIPGVPMLALNRSFGEYLLLCGVLLVLSLGLALYRLLRRNPPESEGEDERSFPWLSLPFAGLAGVLAYAATTSVEEPNGDSWIYLAYVREYVGAESLSGSNPLFGTGTADSYLSFRTTINGWLLEQAALSRAAGIPPVELVLDYLAPALTVFSLLAVYALARILFGRDAALLAGSLTALLFLVDLQATIPTAIMSPGHEIVARVTEDKYVTRFLFLPVALGLAYLYLERRKLRYLLVFALACWSSAVVHPIGLILIGICAAGFGFFHLTTRLRDGDAWKRVIALGGVLLSIVVPPIIYLLATGSPLLSRLDESSSQTEALISTWESSQRLMVLGEDFYIMHPALLLNPVVLAACALGVPFLLIQLKKSLAARLLLGVLVFTPLLIYIPPISTPLAEVVGPWVLARLAWPISLAAPLVLAWMAWELLGYLKVRLQAGRSRVLGSVAAFLPLLLIVVLIAAASPLALASVRSTNETGEVLQSNASCHDPTFRWMGDEIREPATVLAPYEENSCIPALSAANVITLRGSSPHGAADADLRSFFASRTLDERGVRTLLDYEVDYVLLPSGSPLNAQLRHLPGFTPLDNPGQRYRVYAVDREVLTVTPAVAANSVLENGSRARAEGLYISALAGDADEQFLASVGLGISYTDRELYADAAGSYEQALAIYPDEPSLYPPLADAYSAAGDEVSARTVLENGIARFPDTVDLRTQLGSLLMFSDPEAAVAAQREVVNMYPEAPGYRVKLGTLLGLAGDEEAADRQLGRAIDQNPLSASLHADVGLAYQISEREEEAIRHYERALDLDSDLQRARARLEELR